MRLSGENGCTCTLYDFFGTAIGLNVLCHATSLDVSLLSGVAGHLEI